MQRIRLSFRIVIQCFIMVVWVTFALIVYWPTRQQGTLGSVSVYDDCSDQRKARIALVIHESDDAMVDVALLDKDGRATAGTCSKMSVIFPGATAGMWMQGADSSQPAPGVPKFRQRVDAAPYTTLFPHFLGDAEKIDVNFVAEHFTFPPALGFTWINPLHHTTFTTKRVSLRVLRMDIDKSNLQTSNISEVQVVVPNVWGDPAIDGKVKDTAPLGNKTLYTFELSNGHGIAGLSWTDRVRSAIKDIGLIILSLLAGWSFTDLVTTKIKSRAEVRNAQQKETAQRPPRGKDRTHRKR